jgi:pyridoxamine 5'-phosphate oxidase
MNTGYENPFEKFGAWFAQAELQELNDPNAMTLATVGPGGRPGARTVLLKEWDEGGFVFYTNFESRKSAEIKGSPAVALLFHWKSLRRQVRIEGAAAYVDGVQADRYFATRPRGSQIGAWASDQSKPLESREVFEERVREVEARFEGKDVPRPGFWGGWKVTPDYFEFWQDQRFRLHDREIFARRQDGGWETGRLFP